MIRIPTFGSGGKNEIYIIRRHIPGMHYYSPPDWIGSLNYAKLECEISEYLMNEVSNSFSDDSNLQILHQLENDNINWVPKVDKENEIKWRYDKLLLDIQFRRSYYDIINWNLSRVNAF